MIRQRVSVTVGGDITAIKILQGHFGAPLKTPKSKPVPLTNEQRDALIESARKIEDKNLRDAIVALGEAVLTAEPVDRETDPEDPPALPF